ncbi:MAG: hypothetical protein HKN35_04200 [Woeseia sp.]|nr:flippase-like domain-containing protein [Woeseia sp.]MBT8096359.1 flippase-like domain-containing protein [Woeseia sp.]NNE60070.1 hypothetical protein [Woeseia sp.]NNL54985.1 hypothetical protein [Woeseia sp.]
MSRFSQKQAAFAFRVALFIGIAFFLLLFLRGFNFSRLADLNLAPLPLLISAVLSLAFRYWGVFIWRGILKDLGAQVLPSFHILARIFAQSWMARYIPGAIAWISSRVVLASNLGISKSRLTVASLLEAGIQVVAVAASSLVLLSLDERIKQVVDIEIRRTALVVALLMTLLLVPAIFNRILQTIFKLVRQRDAYEELASNGKATFRSFCYYAVGSLVSGLSYFFFVSALWSPTTFADVFYVVGAVNLAAAIGMVTPFVPSGLGTRDASLLFLLSAIYPVEISLAITVASRLWTLFVDFIFLALTTRQSARSSAASS